MQNFLKNNWIYFLWAILYILITWVFLGGTIESLFITLLIYAVSISLALSPIGEVLLRLIEGARPIQTQEEKNYLEPIFEEVYQNAKEQFPNLSDNIELYLMDKKFINTFAFGRNTIAVTTLAVSTFSEDELKGIIGHEFGHIAHGDTKALLLNVIGNCIFTILMFIAQVVITIINFIAGLTNNSVNPVLIVIRLLIKLCTTLLSYSTLLFVLIGEVVLSINSRSNEYNADKFSYEIGFGEELLKALYILQKLSIPVDISLMDRLRSSHPHVASRISRLEELEQG